MPAFPIYNSGGKKAEEIDLPDHIFEGRVNKDVIYQAVLMYRSKKRQGTASTKERGSVSGGGKKPYRQKGTGQARAGSTRSPLWKGGGVVFGPHPRDFGYDLPKKMRRIALRESLKTKYKSSDLMCVDQLTITSQKTKDFVKILKGLKIKGRTLAVLGKGDADILRVSRNIPFFSSMRVEDVNAYDILRNNKILLTKAALRSLISKIK